jgi:serine protease Do
MAVAALKPTFSPALNDEERLIQVVAKASPAVVSILVQKFLPLPHVKIEGDRPIPRVDVPKAPVEVGRGTGFLIASSGLIVTNRHVAQDRDATYTVILSDERVLTAVIIDIDPVNDLALLKISTGDALPYLTLAASDDVRIGQTTIAIGNALGQYANTVTRGILSGLDRHVDASDDITGTSERLEELLQTDAAINAGNSGGPLLNSRGEVIGINTAIENGGQGLSFAIPISEVNKIYDSYKRYGAIARPRFGVRYIPITPELVQAQSLPYPYGALVDSGELNEISVLPGSPAAAAGLAQGDIILEVNGKKLEGKYTLAKAIQSKNVGDAVTLKVARGGTILTLKAQLDAFPPFIAPLSS